MAHFRRDHVHYRSTDPDVMARFFQDLFGAEERDRVSTPPIYRIVLNLDGLTIFIERVPAGTLAPPEPPFIGLEHLALVVDGFETVVEELRGKGARFAAEPVSPRPGLKYCFLQGPEGIRVEVLERTLVPG